MGRAAGKECGMSMIGDVRYRRFKGYGRYLLIAVLSLFLALVFLPVAPQVALAAADDILLCSSDADDIVGDDNSDNASISPDGRYVAFDSLALNLLPAPTANRQVFRKDLWTGEIVLCSSNAGGIQGDDSSSDPSISSDGRYVAFDSTATDLLPAPTAERHVYRKDLWTGEIVLCSSDVDDVEGNGGSKDASITSDGRYVAFESSATNLVTTPTANRQVFRKDLQTGEILLCSSDADGIQGDDSSYNSSVSSDGRYVAFESHATDLLMTPTAHRQIYRKDLDTADIVCCSSNDSGNPGGDDSRNPSMTPDGRHVAFQSIATDLLPAPTANQQIFLKDTVSNRTVLCSSNTDGEEGNGDSYFPSINSDAMYVAFASDADNLLPAPTAGCQIFRKSMETWPTGPIELCSSTSGGIQGDADSDRPSINSNGRYVAFESDAGNLFTTPTANQQVFRKELDIPLPDLWYLAEGYTGGEFDTWVLVQNPGVDPAEVTLGFQVQGGLAPPFGPFTLNGGERFSVHLDDLPGLADAQVSTEVYSDVPVVAERAMYFTYDGKSGGHDSIGVPSLSDTWYLAEGYTGGEFDTWILLQNPPTMGGPWAHVILTFQVQGGAAPPYEIYLPEGERFSVHLDDLPGLADAQVSTQVTSDIPIAAERAMYFTYDGKSGGHDSVGVTAPAFTWYMAEGYTGGEFDTWVLVQNPGTVPAQVTLDFQVQGGTAPPFGPFDLAAGERQSIHLDDLPGLADAQVSTRVTSSQPVVAERAMYFTYDGKSGGHNSKAVNSPFYDWYLAEGYTGGEFDTWVLIQNPGTLPAQVTLDFQVQGGTAPHFGPFNLAAGERQSIHLDTLTGLSDAQVSTHVTSNQPVVAERAMYFTYEGRSGGHDSVGYTP